MDTGRANVARIYDALLGGSHNFAVDRDVASALVAINPAIREGARANRAFLARAVRYLTKVGIRQFLDIGSGVPTEGNVHEIAHAEAPDSRVVYVDTDPVAIAHSRSILAGEDRATIVEADLREPETILGHPEVKRLIDFDRPVALLLVAVLHFITDEERPADLIRRLAEPLVPGSHLVISHATDDGHSREAVQAVRKLYDRASAPARMRDHAAIRRFFDGFDLVEPGLVTLQAWRPDDPDTVPGPDGPPIGYAGVGRKPAGAAGAG